MLLLTSAVVRAQTGAATADSLSRPPATCLTTPSGTRYVVLQLGTGPRTQAGARATVYYQGYLPDGRLFDSTLAPRRPLRVRVGRGEVIPGWDELLLLLPTGTRVRAWIPANLAYGANGVRNPDDDSRYLIPPNTDLRFDLEILPQK
ncbi:MAG TPA: FKBP-type peptidyl-prolyl cis-trans isomerase [Hymenobacter sp.]|nr:FKBP-type peptidyl-prolyl cis-trans isomerase [Hymenobacter sp.]